MWCYHCRSNYYEFNHKCEDSTKVVTPEEQFERDLTPQDKKLLKELKIKWQ